MNTADIFSACKNNHALRLLRENNLPFVLACLYTAFDTNNSDDVSEAILQTAVRKVQDLVFEEIGDTRFSQSPTYYIDTWSRVAGPGDTTAPWLATRIAPNGNKVYTLLPGAAEVMRFFDNLDISRDFQTNTSLKEMMHKLKTAASKLSGNVEHRIAELERNKAEIEAELASIRTYGLKELDGNARAEIANEIITLYSNINAGFRTIPAQMRQHNRENAQIYRNSTLPKGQVINIVADRNKEHRQTPQYQVVRTLYQIRRDQQMCLELQASQDILLDECAEFFTPRQSATVKSFLSNLAVHGHKVYAVEAQIASDQTKYITSRQYDLAREEAIVIQDIQYAIEAVRENLCPSLNDKRLDNVGFDLLVPPESKRGVDLRLAIAYPVKAAPVDNSTDGVEVCPEEAARLTIESARKSNYLSVKGMKMRVATAMKHFGVDEIKLSDVIRKWPLEFGPEEMNHYVSLAGSQHSSRFEIGGVSTTFYTHEGKERIMAFPDPVFTKTGQIAEGIVEFTAHPSTKTLINAIARPRPETTRH